MKRVLFSIPRCAAVLLIVATVFAGCTTPTTATKPGEHPTMAASALPTIRIKAGSDADIKDSKGITWSADKDFEGGTAVDRPDLAVTGTDRPELYKTERYAMDSYNVKVPNGNYVVKLHFSEDYDGINDATERLFTYAVKDGTATDGKTIKEVKDFSPWKAAGDHFKAYVDSVPVTVTSGQISITFTTQVQSQQINAIEIVPQ
jgi:hypothetical protein